MICNCGASCRSSETKEGDVFTCPSCGRRELKSRYQHVVYQTAWGLIEDGEGGLREMSRKELEEHGLTRPMEETMQMFESTVKNLLTMPPMPRKRRKA